MKWTPALNIECHVLINDNMYNFKIVKADTLFSSNFAYCICTILYNLIVLIHSATNRLVI